MTHSPPIPSANQTQYSVVEAAQLPNATLVARMKHNSKTQAATVSRLPVALLVGAALAGAIGYAVWSGRAGSADHR